MKDYGNYDTRVQQQPAQTGLNPPDSSKSNLENLKQIDPKTSEVSLKILSSASEQTEPKPLEKHNFELEENITNENGNASEKTDLVGPSTILESNGKETVTVQQEEIQTSEMIEEQPPEKDSSISDRIKSMNANELGEALNNTDFDKYMDEILERLAELDSKADQTIAEASQKKSELSAIKETETKISQALKDIASNLETKLNAKLHKIRIASEDGKQFGRVTDLKSLTSQNVTIFDKGILTISAEKAKNYQVGQEIEWENDRGEMETVKIKKIKVLTEKQEAALEEFNEAIKDADPTELGGLLGTYFAPTAHLESAESGKQAHATLSTQMKYTESATKEKQTDTVNIADQEKLNRPKVNVEGKSSLTPTSEKRRKEEELRRHEDKIKNEILRHEILVNNIKQNHLKIDANNTSINVEKSKAENQKLENDYKAIKKYLEVTIPTEVPEPLRQKFKQYEDRFHQFDRIVDKANDHPPELVSEIIAFKQEILTTVQSMLKDSGSLSHVEIGKDAGPR